MIQKIFLQPSALPCYSMQRLHPRFLTHSNYLTSSAQCIKLKRDSPVAQLAKRGPVESWDRLYPLGRWFEFGRGSHLAGCFQLL